MLILSPLASGLNVLAFILLFLFMPETKQCALEDLDHTCENTRAR